MKEVCELLNGRAYKKTELLESGRYRVLRVGNFFTNNHWYYSDLELEPRKYCQNGDLLYAWSASFGPRIWTGEKCIYHYHIWKVQPAADRVTRDFLYYFLEWDKERIRVEQGAGATMIHVSKQSMEAREVPVPPLGEQKRIVAVLDQAFAALDRASANAEVNLADSTTVAIDANEKLISRAVATVQMAKLGDCCEFVRGPFGGSLKKACFKPIGYAVYEQQHAIHRRFDNFRYFVDQQKFEQMKRFRVRSGDVIMSCSGTMGRVAVVPPDAPEGIINQALLKLSPSGALAPAFLKRWMESTRFQLQLSANKLGVAIENVASVKTLKCLEVPLLPLSKQSELLKEMEAIEMRSAELRLRYKRKLADVATLRQSLLQAAFSGQLT